MKKHIMIFKICDFSVLHEPVTVTVFSDNMQNEPKKIQICKICKPQVNMQNMHSQLCTHFAIRLGRFENGTNDGKSQ